ncbi:MAG: ABC transporter [Methanomicrobiales archaeon]|nr:ABC transporter [Methanomicrobiales archaeon]
MRVVLEDVLLGRGGFYLRANGVFEEGVHLVSGRIGSGKSTLALTVAGVFPVREGRISREGVTTSLLTLQFPEHQVTTPTIGGEIASWGVEPVRVLGRVGPALDGARDPLTLSRGELKRLQLFSALAKRPDLLLMDEPFSSLDCRSRRELFSELGGRRGLVTIIFSHNTGPLPRIDRLWEIDGGTLVHLGSPPAAIRAWKAPPPYLKGLVARGIIPDNISMEDAEEAMWRI